MPNHDYTCGNCGNEEERFVPLNNLDEMQFCSCGTELKREFPMNGATFGDEAPWLASTTEFLKEGDPDKIYREPVSSRKEYNMLLKEKGLTPVG